MEGTSRNKRRVFHILILTVIGWSILIGRLYVIQIKDTKDFSENHVNLIEKSIQQRKQEFVLSTGRGNIYDRNMESLIEQKEIKTVIVFPFSKNIVNEEKIKKLASILGLKEKELEEQIYNMKAPTYITKNGVPIEISDSKMKEIEKLHLLGIVAIPYTMQEPGKILAKHVIGYLGQAPEVIQKEYKDYMERGILKKDSLIGRSGLQMSFQELLMGIGESKIAYYVDNKGYPLNGLSSRFLMQDDPYYPLSLVTTIDKDIQKLAEWQLKRFNIKEGSVVVLDVNHANILAMASTPDFDLTKVNPTSTSWNNKAVQIIEPGSTFKTVIAIAALEEGVVSPTEKFYCDGKIEEYHFTCHAVHGELSFEEAYAESCNIVFAEVAERLGPEKIEEYANKLGLTGTIGWSGKFFNNDSFKQIANENENRVFHENTNTKDTGAVIRTAIGQQDVRMSPLAMANLVVTILNNGEVQEPRLVEKVIYKNGTDYYYFPVHTKNKLGSSDTYAEIKRLMNKVVDEGTGTYLNQAIWNIAGKTGTAETNNNLNHQWFIGYGPSEDPEYAIAVVVKNVATASPLAKKVFMGIADELAKKE